MFHNASSIAWHIMTMYMQDILRAALSSNNYCTIRLILQIEKMFIQNEIYRTLIKTKGPIHDNDFQPQPQPQMFIDITEAKIRVRKVYQENLKQTEAARRLIQKLIILYKAKEPYFAKYIRIKALQGNTCVVTRFLTLSVTVVTALDNHPKFQF